MQLNTETEVKVKIGDAESFCRQLEAHNPTVVSGRHFEDNHLLDFPDGRLRSGSAWSGCDMPQVVPS